MSGNKQQPANMCQRDSGYAMQVVFAPSLQVVGFSVGASGVCTDVLQDCLRFLQISYTSLWLGNLFVAIGQLVLIWSPPS